MKKDRTKLWFRPHHVHTPLTECSPHIWTLNFKASGNASIIMENKSTTRETTRRLAVFNYKAIKRCTLTRAIFAGTSGTSPLANPMIKICAPQFNNFKDSFVSFPPTGSYRTSTPFSFLALRNPLTLCATFSLLKSTTWSTPNDLRNCTFSLPLQKETKHWIMPARYQNFYSRTWIATLGAEPQFSSSLCSYLATAITVAPRTLPICTAETPTPPAAPRTINTYNFHNKCKHRVKIRTICEKQEL